MNPATQLIHRAEGVSDSAEPLTTPIYETTTFVFENARRSAGRTTRGSRRNTSTRATRTRRSPRSSARLAALEGAEAALRAVERPGGDDDRAPGARRWRRRGRVQRRDLRRHAAPDRRPLPEVRHPPRFVSLDELARPDASCRARRSWSGSSRRSIPTLRCVDIAAVAARLPRPRRHLGHRQHVRQPDQPAAARARRRSRDAQRDEVSQRPQRRHRRRARRTAGADRADARGARKLLGTVLDPYAGVRARPRAEDAGRARGAAQRQRDGGRALGSRRTRGRRRSTIPASRSIPTTRSRGARCADSAGWCASISAAATSARRGSSIGCRSSSAPPASAASRACAACRS